MVCTSDQFKQLGGLLAAHAGSHADALYAGAVLAVAYGGRLIHESAVGHAQTHDGAKPLERPRLMATDTIFDLGSITKVAGTTAAMMKLVEAGRVRLDDALDEHVVEFAGTHTGRVTLRQLLSHRGGLWEWQPTYLRGRTSTDVVAYLSRLALRYEIGHARHYSDLGFLLLGVVIERVTGERLDTYVRRAVHQPLGMDSTFYLPGPGAPGRVADTTLRPRIAATSRGNPYEYRMVASRRPYPVEDAPDDFPGWRDYTLVGEVNDGNAWYGCDGVAGHAGLFSTAGDLVRFGQALVHGGGGFVSSDVLARFLQPSPDRRQALGFWANRLSVAGISGGFGHGGFTGTEFLFDPRHDFVVVLLTNRQHPGEPYHSIAPVWSAVLRHVWKIIT